MSKRISLNEHEIAKIRQALFAEVDKNKSDLARLERDKEFANKWGWIEKGVKSEMKVSSGILDKLSGSKSVKKESRKAPF